MGTEDLRITQLPQYSPSVARYIFHSPPSLRASHIYIFDNNHTGFRAVFWWVGVSTEAYILIAFMPYVASLL